MLKQFVEQLNTDLGEPLAANDDGSYTLFLEPDLHISLRENPELGISLFTVLAPVPEENKEDFLLKTMIANLFGRETGGGILGLNKEGNKITFLTFLPRQLNYRDFHDYLEDFANYADAWKTETTDFIEQHND
ncbi:MAG: type III secretion system chaperone [Chlamydiales bacterium]|nr:type III secretion system chaperone [Chlamydiales bacterium]